MAVISFVIRNYIGSAQIANSAVNIIAIPQRAKLKQVGPDSPGREFIFPFGPQSISFDGNGLNYDITERPGGKGILTAVNKNLRTVSVQAMFADRQTGGKASVEQSLSTFTLMSEEPFDCAFTYGVVTLPFRVRITEVSYTSVRRDLDGNITQAEVEFELTESVEVNQSIVTLTAITYDPPPKPTTTTKNPGTKPKPSGVGADDPYPPYTPSNVTIFGGSRQSNARYL